jgi:D-alanine-D-alanine ligase
MKWVVWYPEPEGSGRADEIDSVQQAAAVAAALRQRRTTAQLMPLRAGDLDRSIAALRAAKPDAVFNLIEEVDGNAGLNLLGPVVLEVLGLPFTGSAADVIGLTTDKPATKVMLRAAGLPTPDWIADGRAQVEGADGAFLLKPARTDASIGIDEGNLVLEPDPRAALAALDRLNGDRSVWMAERYVAGREFNLSILEIDGTPTVLPVPEMRFLDYPPGKPRVVGYRAKWDPTSFEYGHMERSFVHDESDRRLIDELRQIALEAWRLLRLSGYARVDCRVDEEGGPWVLEVNANPGIAPDAGFAAAAAEAGMSYADAIGRIAAAARPHGRRAPIAEAVLV